MGRELCRWESKGSMETQRVLAWESGVLGASCCFTTETVASPLWASVSLLSDRMGHMIFAGLSNPIIAGSRLPAYREHGRSAQAREGNRAPP